MMPARNLAGLTLVLLAGTVGLFGMAGCKQQTGSSGSAPPGADKLNGTGSTFVLPMMEKWAKTYIKEKKVEVNYTGTGSGAGIKQMTEQTVDFGCTDAPMTAEQLAKAKEKNGDVIHIPLVMGAVVPVYNLPGVTKPLKFTGPVLAKIFMLKDITSWDNEEILKLQDEETQKQLKDLKKKEILTVHRAEPSGTTYVFTDYLAQVSEDWKKEMGAGSIEVKWKGGQGEEKSAGVAGYVSRNEGAIGYVEIKYALDKKLSFGALENQEKEFIHPDLENITAAAEAGLNDVKDDLTFNLNNKPGKKSYPICGAVWAVMYVKQPTDKGQALYHFFLWATHEGQELAAEEKYARLPPGLQAKVKEKLNALPH